LGEKNSAETFALLNVAAQGDYVRGTVTATSQAEKGEQRLIVLLEQGGRLARELNIRLSNGTKLAAILASVLEEMRERVQ
jgi:hypothetical protein